MVKTAALHLVLFKRYSKNTKVSSILKRIVVLSSCEINEHVYRHVVKTSLSERFGFGIPSSLVIWDFLRLFQVFFYKHESNLSRMTLVYYGVRGTCAFSSIYYQNIVTKKRRLKRSTELRTQNPETESKPKS